MEPSRSTRSHLPHVVDSSRSGYFINTSSALQTRAKVIWQKATSLDGTVVCKIIHVDIFCHIHQVAARVAKLGLGCIWDPNFGKERLWGQRWYHSKERRWFGLSIVKIALSK